MASPRTFTLSLADWQGAAKNTFVQGLNVHRKSGTMIGHQADDVSGQVEQDVVFRQHKPNGDYIGAITVKKGGHGSSTGLEEYDNNTVRLWFGHDGLKTSGYVQFDIGDTGTRSFVKMDLPEGDIEIDNDNNRLILRNGNRYRLYEFDTVVDNNRVKIADFVIPAWGKRWQGMFLVENRLFVHRDVKTKGDSHAHMFDLTDVSPNTTRLNPVDDWDTQNMGDEAEGFYSILSDDKKSEVVYAVKRTGGTGAKRIIQGTQLVVLPKLKAETPWDGKSFPGVDAFVVGNSHPAVTLLGQRLVVHGWTGYSSGPGPRFSETDVKAVKWFQEKQGWTGSGADGIPGKLTWTRLLAAPVVEENPETEEGSDVAKLPAYYPPANRTTQWYPSIAGGATFTKVDKLILHTTEGGDWFNYAGVGYGPHLTYKPETREWRQHIPLTKSATALSNDGSYKTNQENCIQIEIIGYAKNARLWSLDMINDIAELVSWLSAHGLMIQAPRAFTPYPPGADVKMSRAAYKAARGVIGHEHVPGNSHGDPGDPPIDLVLRAARGGGITPPVQPEEPTAPSKPAEPVEAENAGGGEKEDEPAAFPGADKFQIGSDDPAVTLLGERLVAHGWKGYKVGPGTPMGETDKKGVQWFQGLQGWDGDGADGVPGKLTWAALMEEPKSRPTAPADGNPIFGKVTTGFKAKGSWAWSQGHPGEDWNGEDPDYGDPVFCVRSGVVKYIGRLPWDQKSGNAYGDRALVIQDDSGTTQTLYAHMSAVNVRNGQRVQAGDKIGAIGFSGNVIPANKKGSHLHVERRKSPYRYGTDVIKPVYGD